MGSDETLKAELAKAIAECERLREENARLRLRIGEAPEGAHQDIERSRSINEVNAPPATVTADSRPDDQCRRGWSATSDPCYRPVHWRRLDDARLDTLFLAMPISWRGTLQQYVGRLHRLHADKRIVRVYDYVDASVPVLNRMYKKRTKAYEAVGYTVVRPSVEPEAQADLRFATIERIAVQAVVAFEEARGCKVENIEDDTRGFDLISRCGFSKTVEEQVATRFIEVKGRAAIGEIALTANEYKTALRLGDAYWLYVVFNCASKPQVTTIQNPARFDWEPLSKIDCYRLDSETILKSQSGEPLNKSGRQAH